MSFNEVHIPDVDDVGIIGVEKKKNLFIKRSEL